VKATTHDTGIDHLGEGRVVVVVTSAEAGGAELLSQETLGLSNSLRFCCVRGAVVAAIRRALLEAQMVAKKRLQPDGKHREDGRGELAAFVA
jgi:hypothetical protein